MTDSPKSRKKTFGSISPPIHVHSPRIHPVVDDIPNEIDPPGASEQTGAHDGLLARYYRYQFQILKDELAHLAEEASSKQDWIDRFFKNEQDTKIKYHLTDPEIDLLRAIKDDEKQMTKKKILLFENRLECLENDYNRYLKMPLRRKLSTIPEVEWSDEDSENLQRLKEVYREKLEPQAIYELIKEKLKIIQWEHEMEEFLSEGWKQAADEEEKLPTEQHQYPIFSDYDDDDTKPPIPSAS